MVELLVELLPFTLGLAITPIAIAACIAFLSSSRPVPNALAFTAPFAIAYTIIALVFLIVTGGSDEPLVGASTKDALGIALGLLLLLLALRTYLSGRNRPTRAKSGLLDRIGTATPRVAFVIGLVLAVLNPNVPILMAGLSTVAAADVPNAERVVGTAELVLGAVSIMLACIVWFVLRRESATRNLARVHAWLSKNEREVNITLLLVFGTLFFLKGLVGLLG